MINSDITLWEHQSDTVNRALDTLKDRGYYYILAGCGTGKTLMSLAIVDGLSASRVLIVSTKASLHTTWAREISDKTDDTCLVLDRGTKKNQQALKTDDSRYHIINYEAVWRLKKLPQYDVIISDETHRLSGHTSKQSRAMAKLARTIPYRIGMTGTGFEDRLTQLYGQFRFLTPGKYLRCNLFGTWSDFFEQYAEYYIHDGIKIPTGSKNKEQLMSKIAPYTTILSSEDVLDLPDVINITRSLPLSKKVKRAYTEMKETYITEIASGVITADNVLVHGLRLQQIANGFVTDALTGSVTVLDDKTPKIIETLAILEEIDGAPCVIFTQFRHDVTLLKHALDSNGYTYNLLTGDCKEHGLWQAGQGGQVLIANFSAGSESVDLTRARYGIDYTGTYSNTQYEQSRWRMRRPGADSSLPITYYRLIIEDTIDETIWDTIDNKSDTASAFMHMLAL